MPPPLIRPHAWKPPHGTPIDPAHPLSQGLRVCVPLNEGAGLPIDCVRGVQASSNTGSWVATPYGPAVDYSVGAAAVNFPAVAASYTGPVAFAVLAQVPVSLNGYAILMKGVGYAIDATAGGVHDAPDYNNGSTWAYGPTNATNDGGWHWFALSHNGTATGGVSFYVDGVLRSTGTSAAFPTVTNWLAILGGNGLIQFTGRIAAAMAWSRALSGGEHAAIATNPWQLFRPRSLIAPATAGPTVGYTLAGPGNVTANAEASLLIQPTGTVASDTVTLSDGGHGGTFPRGSSNSWTASSTAWTPTYENATPGTYTLTATSSAGGVIAGSPLSLVVLAAGATRRNRWFAALRRHAAR